MKTCQNCGAKNKNIFKLDAENFLRNLVEKSTGSLLVCKKCNYFFEERAAAIKKIVESDKDKRLIVAGPGTGKTYTFKEVVNKMGEDKKVLIFTLINNLANELMKDFENPRFRNVKTGTFHSYCKNLLYNKLRYSGHYYPAVSLLIEKDSQLLGLEFTEADFHKAFANLEEDSPALEFFLERSLYYETIGYDSSVYQVYNHFRDNESTIPNYDLVIADEYQDFNKLESLFIDLFTKTSPVLIAGDDDQALYGFREASTKYIRDLYYKNPEFDKFNLPFSSRCTKVLVESANHLIKESEKIGRLEGRIDEKEYISYWPEKFRRDLQYPRIQLAHCSKPETANIYVKTTIENITNDEKLTGEEKDIQFLVIGAETQHRLDSLAEYLEENLDEKLYKVRVREEKEKIKIEKGFQLVHKDSESNLGWRIILHDDPPEGVGEIIKLSHKKGALISSLLPKDYREKYLSDIEKYFSQDENLPGTESEKPGREKIQVKLVNCLGAKGLSVLHVIILEFHNGVFPRDKTGQTLTDEDIYRCVVSLTRAKRSCSLVTFKEFDPNMGKLVDRSSKLLEMLPEENLSELQCKIKDGKLICSK